MKENPAAAREPERFLCVSDADSWFWDAFHNVTYLQEVFVEAISRQKVLFLS